MLGGRDRRSIGNSDAVAAKVLAADGYSIRDLLECMHDDDPRVRMRSADAAEKVSRVRPDLLQPCLDVLIRLAATSTQAELRWHLAQMLPRLELSGERRTAVMEHMLGYLEDESRIVRAFALEALCRLAHMAGPQVRRALRQRLAPFERTGSPAVRAKARRFLSLL
jgi:hypothetical protein